MEKQTQSTKIRQVLAFITVLAFLSIQDYDRGGSMPLLVWSVVCAATGELMQRLFFNGVIASWLYLLITIFATSILNTRLQIGAFFTLCIAIGWISNTHSTEASVSKISWFWVPSVIFFLMSFFQIYLLFNRRGQTEV